MVARGDSEIFFDALALADVRDLYPGRGVELLGRLLEALAGASAPANDPAHPPGMPAGRRGRRSAGTRDRRMKNAQCRPKPTPSRWSLAPTAHNGMQKVSPLPQ
jgi:hypothetical protein